MKPRPVFFAFLVLSLGLFACVPIVSTDQAPPLIVQTTFSAQPWLGTLHDCAGENILQEERRAVDFLDLENADLVMRLGEAPPGFPAFQVGSEEIVVVVHPENPVGSLTAPEVLGLFTGSIHRWGELDGEDTPVQVWVYPAGEEAQQNFELSALGGAPVSSQARMVSNPEAMSEAIAADPGAIGFLPRSWIPDSVKEARSVVTVPVLVILPEEADESMADLLTCLQK